MKTIGKKLEVFCVFVVIFLLISGISNAQEKETYDLEKFQQLRFMKNQGQWEDPILYKTHYNGVKIAFLEGNEISYCISREMEGEKPFLPGRKEAPHLDPFEENESNHEPYEYLVWNQVLLGANLNSKITEQGYSDSKTNYFLGNDSSRWVKNCAQFDELTYQEVYPNIDFKHYSNKGKLKYDYIVRPGGKTQEIQISFKGIEKLKINKEGQLIIHTTWGKFMEEAPYSYIKESKEKVLVAYELLNDSTFGYVVNQEYDRSKTLIIDPYSLCWSTFLGGSGSYYNISMNVDQNGETLNVGFCDNSHPITAGVYQSIYGGGAYDMFVTKISEDGSSLIFSTFIGGDSWEQNPAVNILPSGEILLRGETGSVNFPTTSGAYQTTLGGAMDVFVLKLSANGSNMLFSSFVGGSDFEQLPVTETIVTQNEFIFSGITYSGDFPVTAGVFQSSLGGSADLFIMKFDFNGNLIFSSYLGGTDNDTEPRIDVTASGDIILLSTTTSLDFPIVSGAFQQNLSGASDLSISIINSSGSSLIASTYFGGTSDDLGYYCKESSAGDIVIVGRTESLDYPVSVGAYQMNYGGQTDLFITTLNNNLSSIKFSTFLGGTGNEYIQNTNFEYDNNDFLYLVGRTESSNVQTTSGVIQGQISGGFDGLLLKINISTGTPDYCTYLGGTGYDRPLRLFVNASGEPLIIGSTESSNFPVSSSAYQNTYGGNRDVFVTLLDNTASSIKYSTFFGGNDLDYSRNEMPGKLMGCQLYIAPTVHSTNFPVTPGAYQTIKTHTGDTPVVLKMSICDQVNFDIIDSTTCSNASLVIDAPTLGGIWSDGSTLDSLIIKTPGTYWFEADTGCGNIYRDSFEVKIAESYLDFNIEDTSICSSNLLVNAPVPNGTWSDGSSSDPFTITNSGTYWYESIDSCGNIYRDSFFVDLGSTLFQDIQNFSFCQGQFHTIIPDVKDGVWSDGSSNDFFIVKDQGNYWYVYDDGCGNQIKDEFMASTISCDSIECEPPYFYIPNTFTPEGDGLNDQFHPTIGSCIEYYKFQIFNRWGTLLFETENPMEKWDGLFNDLKVQQEVYVWKMEYKLINSRTLVEYGHVLVLR